MDLGEIAMKEYSILFRYRELDPYHKMQFSVIPRTDSSFVWGEILPLYWGYSQCIESLTNRGETKSHTHTHTHTHSLSLSLYIYIYIYSISFAFLSSLGSFITSLLVLPCSLSPPLSFCSFFSFLTILIPSFFLPDVCWHPSPKSVLTHRR